VHNPSRRHSSIGYLSPTYYEKMTLATPAAYNRLDTSPGSTPQEPKRQASGGVGQVTLSKLWALGYRPVEGAWLTVLTIDD
jgi:hypothetical protein